MRSLFSLLTCAVLLSACGAIGEFFPDFQPSSSSAGPRVSTPMTPSMPQGSPMSGPIRPETLVHCRGHVLVPALGMTFVPTAGCLPSRGQYLREESLTPPYRILPPGASATMDFVPQRLNVDLDSDNRIVNLRCG